MESEELITLIEQAFPSHPVPKITFRQRTLSDQGMSRDISEEEWENVGRVDRDDAQLRQVAVGRYAGRLPEHASEVKGGQDGDRGKRVEGNCLVQVHLHVVVH